MRILFILSVVGICGWALTAEYLTWLYSSNRDNFWIALSIIAIAIVLTLFASFDAAKHSKSEDEV